METGEQIESLRQATENMWQALSELGYQIGLASGQEHGSTDFAEAFSAWMTEARSHLNRILPPEDQV